MAWRRLLLEAVLALTIVGVTTTTFAQPLLALSRTVDFNELTTEVAEPEVEHDAMASELRDGRITRGFIRHRMIHFTFDDGPRLDTTPELLEHLDAYDVHATFFVVARGFDGRNRVDRAKAEVLRDIVARGHTIGGHTYDHSRLTGLDEEGVRAQLVRSEKIFVQILGARPYLFRAPYGARDAQVDAIVASRGYTQMLWNITSADTTSRTADEVAEAFRASLDRRERHPRGPGGIVLLHDTKPWVVEAFPQMMEELRGRNCELLESGEELWDVVGEPSVFHQSRGNNPSQQARTVELEDEVVAARQINVRAAAEAYCQAAPEATEAATEPAEA